MNAPQELMLELSNVEPSDINSADICSECIDLKQKLKNAELENEKLKKEIHDLTANVLNFLNEDQIAAMKEKPRKWQDDTIIKAYKLRFAFGVHGYEFLRQTGYPAPGYSTLTERLRRFRLSYGIFEDILEPLTYKVQQMDHGDRLCVMSVDEMEISSQHSYDKSTGKILGNVTLGDSTKLGKKLFVVLIRGLKNNWKQIIGAHITDGSPTPAARVKFIEECLKFCSNAGLHVTAFSSDMGNENRALWKLVKVELQKDGIRNNQFQFRGETIFVMPDVCHILKNLKSSCLKNVITLPTDYCDTQGLPSNIVKSSYLLQLWNSQIDSGQEIRSLYHLKRQDLYPDNFEKMDVAPACRFFSEQTAAAIELAVRTQNLPKEAGTTAHFIRVVHQWFTLSSSKIRKTSITKKNKETKFDVLEAVIHIAEGTLFGKGWKPLNVGLIMSSLSLMDICETSFLNGYDFFMSHRLSQDALENIFSQVRRKFGKTPHAAQCLQALKTISISQFISDVKNTNYCNDSDVFLLDFFSETSHSNSSSQNVVRSSSSIDLPSTFETESLENLICGSDTSLLNNLFYIAGSTTNAVKKTCCESCVEFLLTETANDFFPSIKSLVKLLNKGGLISPCAEVLHTVIQCNILYEKFRQHILRDGTKIIVTKIVNDLDICYPNCAEGCDVKFKIVKHFFTVRSYALANLTTCGQRTKMYGTSSANKKQKVQGAPSANKKPKVKGTSATSTTKKRKLKDLSLSNKKQKSLKVQ